MANVNIRPEEFPSNSHKSKAEPPEKKVKKVINGKVVKQKRGFSKRLAETFLEEDSKSVGSYILHDILIPALKSLIFDAFSGGLEASLFGGKQGRNTRREGGRSYTSYGSYYKSTDRDRRDDRRDISRTGRARHDFGEIVLETRGEAEEVLSHLVDLTIDYGMASVADLYDLVGITSNFTDNKYGWTDLCDASVSRARRGYLINLPRPRPLD